jgi:hypothetical protein
MHYISAHPRNALHFRSSPQCTTFPLIPAKAGIQFLELPYKPGFPLARE